MVFMFLVVQSSLKKICPGLKQEVFFEVAVPSPDGSGILLPAEQGKR